jgi:glutathione S-transferase
MQLQLVSMALCPYVQRAVILLLEKNAPHEVTYVDLDNKPAWLLDISPRGKVPVLVAGGTPLFESQAICEYLEETIPDPRMMPTDPVQRARDRAWFGYAEDLFGAVFSRAYSVEQAAYDKAGEQLLAVLTRLDRELAGRAWLSGDGSTFGMADVAMVPAFTRIAYLDSLGSWGIPASLANVCAWSERMLARPSVKGSMPADADEQTTKRLRARNAISVRA